jgi:Gas vesicle protein G
VDILFSILTLPYAPVRGVTALAKVLLREAENELYGQASIRRQLEELDEAVAAGRMSPDERAQAEQAILDRLMG